MAVLGSLGALARVPLASAQFTASAVSAGSSFGAADSFCTAPGTVVGSMVNDTWVNEADPGRNYRTDIHLEVRARTGQVRRTLMRPALPPAPAGCTLVSAVLTLDEHGFAARTMQIHRVTSAWDVTTVDWDSQPPVGGTPVEATTVRGTWTVDIAPVLADIYASGANHGFRISDSSEASATTFDNTWHSIDDRTPPFITYTWA